MLLWNSFKLKAVIDAIKKTLLLFFLCLLLFFLFLEGTNEKPALDWMSSLNFSNVPKKIFSQLVMWRSSSYDEFSVSN